ncbi:MAG: 50S ribosomal protein L3 [Actinobacteria bacterium]|nr:50S ribosomal protein L3 [Actinomycetota bacterium]
MMKTLLGTKVGMTQIFTADGTVVPVTVIQAGPCVVTQKKTVGTDGYEATQIAFGDVKPKRLNKPLLGHLKKAGVSPKAHLVEVPGPSDLAVGDVVDVSAFVEGDVVKVTGISKGKGFQGVMKRHGFGGGPAGHGTHFHRTPGSIGASADPARVFRGSRLPGQMGNDRVTQRGLTVVSTDGERNLILVKGSIPGGKGSLVVIRGQ